MRRSGLTLFWVLLAFPGCRESIYQNLSEEQANSAMVALSATGIRAEKSHDGANWQLEVESKDRDRALATLVNGRIFGRGDEEQLPSVPFLASREERESWQERELSQQLNATLERVPGVVEARVHLLLERSGSWSGTQTRRAVSASVLIITSAHVEVHPNELKRIVNGATALSAERIEVVIMKQRVDNRDDNKEDSPESSRVNGGSEYKILSMPRSRILTIGILVGCAFLLPCFRFMQRRFLRNRADSKYRVIMRDGKMVGE